MSTATLGQRGIVSVCPSCGQKNRVPFAHVGETGTCGRCGAPLPAPAEPVEIDSEATFEALVGAAPVPVVVGYWAPWCGPCRMVAPEMAKVARAQSGRLIVAKVNTEALQGLAARHQIASIPTLAVYAGGREVARTTGARPAAAVEDFVRQAVGG